MFFLTMLVLCVLIPLQVAMYRAIRQAGLENERLRGRVVTAQEVLLSKRKYVVGLLPKSLDPSVSALAGKALIDCTEHGILNDPARDGDVLHLVGMAQRGGHET